MQEDSGHPNLNLNEILAKIEWHRNSGKYKMNNYDKRFPHARVSVDAHIEIGVQIGKDSIIEEHCSIINDTTIGKNCHIRSGTRIGAKPFDFRITKDGVKRSDQYCPVIIEDGCEIGHNVVIQTGIERNTIIRRNSLINNLCNIGHDIYIGEETVVGLTSSISGYTTIGDRVAISPGVTILNRVTIGDDVTIGIGSLVLHDCAKSDSVLGRPAVTIDQYKYERKALKTVIFGEYKPSKISTNKNMLKKVLKRIVRRFI